MARKDQRTQKPTRSDRKKDAAGDSAPSPIDKNLTDLFAELEKGDINSKSPPSVKLVEWFHRNAGHDRDIDLHHLIGTNPGDVARGNHVHDGRDSPALWTASQMPASPAATTASLKTAVDAVIALLTAKSA